MSLKIDPWSAPKTLDYKRLLEVFGIRPFKELVPLFREKGIPLSLHMRRGIIFGHRDLDRIMNAYSRGEKVAVLTGFMPSGRFHFGHKMTADQLIYYQRLGFKVFVALADAEAFAVRRLPRSEIIRIGIEEYVANLIALGLDAEKTVFYFQTNRGTPYYRLVQLFSGKVTMSEMEAIYGDLTPGKVMAAFTQASDILHVELPEYGGYKHVVVPVGADQDPHLRLARDLAERMKGIVDLLPPASTYHTLIPGLDGAKMSSSRPDYTIFLTDPPELARKKLMAALTGGRPTAEEQRRLGGMPDKCVVFQLYRYHLVPDDEALRAIREECETGRILCGPCKRRAADMLVEFLREHQEKLKNAVEVARRIVEPPSF